MKKILEIGGNVATQSDVYFPKNFDNNKGYMDGIETAGNIRMHSFYNGGAISTTHYGYNVFSCDLDK